MKLDLSLIQTNDESFNKADLPRKWRVMTTFSFVPDNIKKNYEWLFCPLDHLGLLYGVDPLPLKQIVSFNFLFHKRSSFYVGVVRGRVKMGVEPVLNHILKSSKLYQLFKYHNDCNSFETPSAQNPCIHPYSVKIASDSRSKLVDAPINVHWWLFQGSSLSQRNEKYPSIVSLQYAKYPAMAILKYSK